MKSVSEYNAFLYNGGILCGFSDTTKIEMNLSSCFASIDFLMKSEIESWKKEIEYILKDTYKHCIFELSVSFRS